MFDFNFNTVSANDLAEIQKKIQAEIKNRKDSVSSLKDTIVAEFNEMANRHGVTHDELIKLVGGKVKTQVKAKYKNPASDETWTGRGRKPVWVTNCLSAGLVLADLVV